MSRKQDRCEKCDYCPECGRSKLDEPKERIVYRDRWYPQPYPYYPYWGPNWSDTTTWPGQTITVTSGTNTSVSNANAISYTALN